MDTNSAATNLDVPHAMPGVELDVAPARCVDFEEYFLRFVVVALGMLVGAILAGFIGLVTGWIGMMC